MKKETKSFLLKIAYNLLYLNNSMENFGGGGGRLFEGALVPSYL